MSPFSPRELHANFLLSPRPDLLATEPIVIFFTLWISIAWAVMYGLVQSIPYVFREVYGFGTGRVGLVYLALT